MSDMSDFEKEEYYVHRKGSFVGNAPVFWAKGGNGYTSYIQGAERFPEADAKKLHREDSSKWKLYKCSEVDARLHLVYDMQDDNRLGTDAPCGWPWGYADKQSMQGEAKDVGMALQYGNDKTAAVFDAEIVPIGTKLYTHAPDSAARIVEQDAEIARLTKELEEARKDAEAVAWHRETAGGIAICYVQNEPPKDADGPWHPLFTSARKTWIPMNEQRPIEEQGNKVLGFSDGYIFDCEYEYSDGEGRWCNITGETMTHWMPRPPEPDASLNIKGGAE